MGCFYSQTETDIVVAKQPFVTREEFEKNDGKEGRNLYILISGKVYNVTHFDHPGGMDVYYQNRLTDKEERFKKIEKHKEVPKEVYDKYLVGPLQTPK